jgi:hypothetical protein
VNPTDHCGGPQGNHCAPIFGLMSVSVLTSSQELIDAVEWTKKRTAGPGSGVMETSQVHGSVDDVAAGEDVGLRTHNLAIAITTGTLTVGSTGSHC